MMGFILSGCDAKKDAQKNTDQVVKQVQVTTVSSLTTENRTDLASLLEAGEETLASFEIGGRVLELLHEEGDAIEPGDQLARLDASEYDVQLAQAEMALHNAEIAYQQALDSHKRFESLYAAGAVSKTDFEGARDALATAENGKQLAERSLALVSGKDCLNAPIKGVVINKLVSKGQLVSAGAPAYRIGQIDELKVVLPVPDYEIRQWKTDDAVTLTLYGESREGKVTKVNPATNTGTGTIGVEVKLPNPKHDWHPGQVVQVARKINGKNSMFVPVQSVINRGEKEPFVFVAANGKAVKKPVQIGAISGQYLEITSGLTMGEQVVSRGADRLFDGDRIESGGSGE
ncbi:MAG TPA: efflux RND transporter periplasmic adaptor subunit [Syntrophomonadaceae bacterium]|nr:efflux RND transporter periplasmic adaptor subunit [Syntrophomonadaceae bacterium]